MKRRRSRTAPSVRIVRSAHYGKKPDSKALFEIFARSIGRFARTTVVSSTRLRRAEGGLRANAVLAMNCWRACCDGMPRMKGIGATMALSLAVPSFFGCAESWHTATPIRIRPTDTYAVHAQEGGLSAAVEPFDTDATLPTLGSEQLPHRFTPILLIVENRTAEKLHLDRSNAKLVCADGTTRKAISALAMYEQLRDESDDEFMLFGRSSYLLVLANNERKKTDWMAKEFPAETILTKGRRTAGLLYFRGKCRTQVGRKLHITVDKLLSPDSVKLDLDLN